MLRRTKVLLLLAFAACFLAVNPGTAQAQSSSRKNYVKGDGFKQGEQITSRKKKYIHPCGAGTEQVGKHPAEGGNVVFCRQPVAGGFRKQGLSISWYTNGNKHFEGEFHQDKKHGRWTVYDRNGRKKLQEEYYNGKLQKRLVLDKNGAPVDPADRRVAREKKVESDSWRKELRTKVVTKRPPKDSGWVKKNGNRHRTKLF